MTILLVIIAILLGVGGAFTLTPATLGTGIIAGACLLAIVARIVQANSQHAQIMRALKRE